MKKKKHQGKKKYGGFFLRWFLFCLTVAAGLVGWLYFYKGWDYCNHVQPRDFFEQCNTSYERTLEDKLQRADENGRSIPEALSGFNSGSGCAWREAAWVLFQPITGEFYCSKTYAMAAVLQNGEKKYYSLYDEELLSALKNAENMYYSSPNPIVYSIYVKDDQFVPGEVYVKKDKINPRMIEGKDGKKIPGKWVDLSPENTEGWTKICSRQSKEYLSVFHDNDPDESETSQDTDKEPYLKWVGISGFADAPHADAVLKYMEEEIPQRFELYSRAKESNLAWAEHGEITREFLEEWNAADQQELKQNISDRFNELLCNVMMDRMSLFVGNDNIENSVNKNCEFGVNEIRFRGQPWQLFHFQYIDPKKYYLVLWFQDYPYIIYPVLILTLLVSLALSVITYLIYSRRYDIDAYRRNLTSALAHDLKTPLAVIYGNAENLRAHTHPENADEYADCIMENVTHIDEMIAGVLGLSRLEGRAKPEMKDKVDLTALLHTAFQRNAAQMEARGLTLSESGTTVVKGNSEMLAQLAENLVTNAVQHTAEGGKITVTADKKTLRISNPYTGELDETTLCEPFRRGDAARGSQSGTGLGLSIVQQIAALHKIRLRVTAREGIFTAELRIRPGARRRHNAG